MDTFDAPIRRIVGVMISYALRDQAQEIRVQPTGKGNAIHYRFGNQWRKEMDLPDYVLSPLLAHLTKIAKITGETPENPREGRFDLKLKDPSFDIEFNVSVQVRLYPVELGQRIHLEFIKRNEDS